MRSRYKRIDTKGSDTTTTLYIGSVEKVSHADGRKEWKRTIGGGLGVIIQEVEGASVVSETHNYFIKDHLGSINLITDSFGDVIAEMDYDPWGLKRDTTTWKELTDSIRIGDTGIFTQPTTTRGFTGHEMLDDSRLIHMNGRIYDPKIARFVQADPIIQDPYKSASLNRYSYVWNNPLNATEPSGFEADKKCAGGDNDCKKEDEDEDENHRGKAYAAYVGWAMTQEDYTVTYTPPESDGVSKNSGSANAGAGGEISVGVTMQQESSDTNMMVFENGKWISAVKTTSTRKSSNFGFERSSSIDEDTVFYDDYVFEDGDVPTRLGHYGVPQWYALAGDSELAGLLGGAIKNGAIKGFLNAAGYIDVAFRIQLIGEFEKKQKYKRTIKYLNVWVSPWDFDQEILKVGSPVPVGQPFWEENGNVVDYEWIDSTLCAISCDADGLNRLYR